MVKNTVHLLVVGVILTAVRVSFTDAAFHTHRGGRVAPVSTVCTEQGFAQMKLGPAVWACTSLYPDTPERSYDTLMSYLKGANAENRNIILEGTTWPLVEKTGKVNELCVYIKKSYQCYPPKPITSDVTIKSELALKSYYGRTLWGEASTERVNLEVAKLKKMLNDVGVTSERVDFDTLYLSSFENHVKEVRFDIKPESAPAPPAN